MIAAWWSDLSSRERVLMAAAGALAVVLVVSQLVVAPASRARADAANSYARAVTDLDAVRAGAAALAAQRIAGPDAAAGTPGPAGDVRAIVAQTAVRAGIGLSRTTPMEDGVSVVIDAVSSQDLFAWLIVLRNEYGVTAETASIARVERTGLLRANLTLVGEDAS